MAFVISDNIISPLGFTSESNYEAVKGGRTGLRTWLPGTRNVPGSFTASLLSDEQTRQIHDEGMSCFESMAVCSARKAITDADIDVSRADTVLIVSTTKGSVEEEVALSPGDSAQHIASALGFTTMPIVVCNACISGLAAIILANRLIEEGRYENAVVCGADCQGHFIISGFKSLRALSPEECRPFDIERLGLNLGEAAATMVLSRKKREGRPWHIESGAVRNDAYHISAPSRKGEGLWRAIRSAVGDKDINRLALVSAHGTATMFNDQMESVALERMGLTATPVNGLKGYYGHTMGAAGILETIISMHAVDDHTVPGTRHLEELGVSGNIDISPLNRRTGKGSFLKILSGFGGCNAAVWISKEDDTTPDNEPDPTDKDCCCHSKKRQAAHRKTHSVRITPQQVEVDGTAIHTEGSGADMLTYLYKEYIGGYSRFYKMDRLCRLGFVASELLLQAEGSERFIECEDRAVVFFNHSSSVDSDRKYIESMNDRDNYYPSPSVFVYTLPNIVTGEIAIRNHYHGETSFYILPHRNEDEIDDITDSVFADSAIRSAMTGWIDYQDDTDFAADISIVWNERRDNTAANGKQREGAGTKI